MVDMEDDLSAIVQRICQPVEKSQDPLRPVILSEAKNLSSI
jgi:hypothetical protein